MRKVYLLVALNLLGFAISAQISITSTNTAYTENFDAMLGTAVNATLTVDQWRASDNTANTNTWATANRFVTTVVGGSSAAVSAGGFYNYGNGVAASATDRALGFLSSGSSPWTASAANPLKIFAQYINETGAPITQIDVSFDVEKYRNGSNAQGFTMNFFYSLDGETWVAVPSGNQSFPADGNNNAVNPPSTTTKNVSITGLNIADGENFYLRWAYSVTSGATATNAQGLAIDNVSVTATGGTATPGIALSSPNPAVPLDDIVPGTGDNPIYRFDLAVTSAATTLNSVSINTTGTYTAADVTGYRLYYSTDNILGPPDVMIATLPSSGPGLLTFSGLTQVIPVDATGYFFVTVQLSCPAVPGNTIAVNAITTGDLSFSSGNVSGSTTAGGTQTIIAVPPNNVTGAGATNGNTQSVVSWTNPIACFDEVLVVAATATNTGTPTGDGTAYTPDPAFPNGTALGNGFVVYKGTAPQNVTVTGLTNGTTYYFKIFGRFGTMWNSGVEVTATPEQGSSPTDYFRSAGNGNWGNAATWESSPDNSSWSTATLVPDANANTITIRNGHTVTVVATTSADQVVVEAGATLTLSAAFTLADGAGSPDMIVQGTVVNTAGTHVITGTIAFQANSLYQHNRNGSPVLTASWNGSSTVEIVGIAGTAPTGLGQSFGNFTWNCPGQSGNIGLGNPAGFTINGNLTVLSTGGVTNRAFRFTAGTNYSLNVGGDLVLNGGHLGLSSGSGATELTVFGNVTVTNNSEFYLSQGGSANSTLILNGDLTINSGTITETGTGTNNTIRFIRAGTQTFNATSATISNTINYFVDPSPTIVLNNNFPVNAGATMVMHGTLNAGANQLTGAGNVEINGTLNTTNPNGIGATGTLANTGTTVLGPSSQVNFNGAGTQPIAGRNDYFNLTINNGGENELEGNAVVNGMLDIANGKILLGANNLVVAGAINSSSNNYIVTDGAGVLTRNNVGASDVLFPVGPSTTLYHPATLNNAGTIDNFSVRVESTTPVCAPPLSSVTTTWDISEEIIGGSDCTITLDYTGSATGASYSTVGAQIIHCGGANYHNGSVTGTIATGSGFTEFSPFGITNDGLTLPVNFTSLKATQQTGGIKVEWTNLTESDVQEYTIERSVNGSNFVAIGTVAASHNNGGRADYSYLDISANDMLYYYRINAKGFDASSKYSNIVRVNTRAGAVQLGIYPNPATGNQVNMQASALPKGQYTLRVINATGQQIMTKQLQHNGGSVTQSIELPATVRAGMYNLQLIGGDVNLTKTFIIR